MVSSAALLAMRSVARAVRSPCSSCVSKAPSTAVASSVPINRLIYRSYHSAYPLPPCRPPRTPDPTRSACQLHSSHPLAQQPRRTFAAPRTHDRGPPSDETTQTDFGNLDIFSETLGPSVAIDSCLDDGFVLGDGRTVHGAGVLCVGGEAFWWRPWASGEEMRTAGAEGKAGEGETRRKRRQPLLNARGLWEVGGRAWGVLEAVWPKPDLLILGTGPTIQPLAPATRAQLSELGIRVEVLDTRNAASQFNLLATERGVHEVAAAMVPLGWKEGGG